MSDSVIVQWPELERRRYTIAAAYTEFHQHESTGKTAGDFAAFLMSSLTHAGYEIRLLPQGLRTLL